MGGVLGAVFDIMGAPVQVEKFAGLHGDVFVGQMDQFGALLDISDSVAAVADRLYADIGIALMAENNGGCGIVHKDEFYMK